ncbi:type II toxin-antitoxin system RelE/ParE family toxin [Magnetococcus sp. PR-3]|uniref:type II toxin-antitoxin system RelE/ParE family toxin n=1 Tax=Magnetococcus sp. PR-3 TaxID=3120355 RepID=UPI002FCDFA13
MTWHVETLNATVDAELAALDPHLRGKFLYIAELLETFGPQHVREPYVKSLGNKLWEMRMKGPRGIARAIYITVVDRRIVVLHVFVKKTQKTPRSAIETALSRAREIEQ